MMSAGFSQRVLLTDQFTHVRQLDSYSDDADEIEDIAPGGVRCQPKFGADGPVAA